MTTTSSPRAAESRRRVDGRTIGGLTAVVLLVTWVLVNRDSVDVSFLLWSAQVPLWLALSLAGVLGGAAGFLLGRSRYRGSRRRS